MARPAYWVSRVPVLSTSHLTRETLEGLQTSASSPAFATVACYAEGVFLYLWSDGDPEGMPADLLALRRWVSRRGYGWIRLDADGDQVDGLPTYDW